ncbi:MAG: adenine phosphoribosyltransferase [Nanoarchaeota archaeon]|nr:adenine phosphoribosyltransferase [Nanoarchaeota archaeon]
MNKKIPYLETYIRPIEDFPKQGILFQDITPLLNNAQAFATAIDELVALTQDIPFDKIGAFDARGFLFGPTMAYATRKPFFPLRKPGKLPYTTITEDYGLEYGTNTLAIHIDAIHRGERILLVDDVLATGGTMQAGCKLVKQLEGIVAGCCTLVELPALKGREKLNGYDVRSLLTY